MKTKLIANVNNLPLYPLDKYTVTRYWCLKPSIIDKNRRENGDYCVKPTQYYFVGFEPKYNLVFEPIEYVEQRRCSYITNNTTGRDRQIVRSEIHPQYANRFIRQYIIDEERIDIFGKIKETTTDTENGKDGDE